jgi:hypothetical protein
MDGTGPEVPTDPEIGALYRGGPVSQPSRTGQGYTGKTSGTGASRR